MNDKQMTGGEVGQRAPEIDLPMVVGGGDQAGRWRLSDQLGRPVVLFFYPGDETPVCTRQLCSVRDHWAAYEATGAVLVGINTDSLEAHRSFGRRYHFPFPLLSDANGSVVRAYGMASLLGVRRGVVVIDPTGQISYRKVVFPLFRPSDEEILSVLQSFA